MLSSNHKKLVNACYLPVLKHNHFHPDPNALSKLVYYCLSRPHKSKKVSQYLLQYAHAQALPPSLVSSLSIYRNSKPGLICTIHIFRALIANLAISQIANDILSMVAIGLGLIDSQLAGHPNQPPGYFANHWLSADIDITLASIELFGAFAERLDPDSLQDVQVARNYLFLLAKFSSVAMVSPPTSLLLRPDKARPARAKSARALALVALHSALKSPGLYSSAHFTKQMRMIIPGLLASILPGDQRDPAALLDIIHRSPQDHSQSDQALVSEADRYRALSSSFHPDAKPHASELDLLLYSSTLVHLLLSSRLATLSQFELCLTAMLSRLEATLPPASSSWCAWFGTALLGWTPPKHRPLIIDQVLDRLSFLAPKRLRSPSPETALLDSKMAALASMLLATLTDPLVRTIALLNVSRIQHELVRLLAGAEPALQATLVACEGALGGTLFYEDQIGDLARDLLVHVTSLVRGPTQPHDPRLATALLRSLDTILTCAHAQPPSHRPVPVAIWTDCFALLDDLHDPTTRHAFAQALLRFLKLEAFRTDGPGCADGQHGAAAAAAATGATQLGRVLGELCVRVFEGKTGGPDQTRLVADPMPVLISGVIPSVHRSSSIAGWTTSSAADSVPLEGLPMTGKATTLADCLVEAHAHRHHVPVLVCVPMLRELDRFEAAQGGRPRRNGEEADRDRDRDRDRDQDVVGKCLGALGTAWGMASLSTAEGMARDEAAWTRLVRLMSGHEGIQMAAGMTGAELEARLLGERWSVEEARRMAESGANKMLGRRASGVSKRSGTVLRLSARSGRPPMASNGSLNGLLTSPGGSGSSSAGAGARMSPSVSSLRNTLLVSGFARGGRQVSGSACSCSVKTSGSGGGGGGGGRAGSSGCASEIIGRAGAGVGIVGDQQQLQLAGFRIGSRKARAQEVLEKLRVASEGHVRGRTRRMDIAAGDGGVDAPGGGGVGGVDEFGEVKGRRIGS